MLRSTEEPWARALSRRWALRGATPRYLLFRRWRPPRSGLFRHYLGARFTEAELPAPIRLTGCLALTHAGVFGSDAGPATFAFAFRADGPCPDDLALRLAEVRPRDTIDPRTVVNDLLCDGLASPALFGEGDVVWSVHDPIGLRVRDAAREGVLVGLVRESGARPERSDPTWVEVPLRRLAGLPPRGAWTMR
ncbi:MAG: hypothetical protein IT379_32995 [Deltaproteobacteria bacterium]|nr:hypothetical protein [Deltaproteobacteria bacterium]